MAAPRKLLLLDPEHQLLMEFKTKTEQVITESQDLLDSVPKIPVEVMTEEHVESARDLLDCLIVIQGQVNELEKTYKHMKNYIFGVITGAELETIASKDAMGYLSSRSQFDQKKFKVAYPDLYSQYIKQTAPFLVVKRKA